MNVKRTAKLAVLCLFPRGFGGGSVDGAARGCPPDLRGHGDSDKTDYGYSLTEVADDLAGLLDALAVPKAAVNLTDPVAEGWVRDSLSWFPLFQPVPEDYLEDRVRDGCKVPAQLWKSSLTGLVSAVPPTEAGETPSGWWLSDIAASGQLPMRPAN